MLAGPAIGAVAAALIRTRRGRDFDRERAVRWEEVRRQEDAAKRRQ
jgi:hypothetical protein